MVAPASNFFWEKLWVGRGEDSRKQNSQKVTSETSFDSFVQQNLRFPTISEHHKLTLGHCSIGFVRLCKSEHKRNQCFMCPDIGHNYLYYNSLYSTSKYWTFLCNQKNISTYRMNCQMETLTESPYGMLCNNNKYYLRLCVHPHFNNAP